MEIGRNDLCPCGSGKKYKKCCLQKDVNAQSRLPLDFAYESHLILRGNVTEKMERLMSELLSKEDAESYVTDYWDSIFLEDDEIEALRNHPVAGPDLELQMVRSLSNAYLFGDLLPARYFLEAKAGRFTANELAFLREFDEARLTYIQLREFFPEEGYTLAEDIFDGKTIHLFDKKISRDLKPHDILSARLVPIPAKDGHVLELLAGSIIPPDWKRDILDMIGDVAADFVNSGVPKKKHRAATPAEILKVLKDDPMLFYWMDMAIWHDKVFAPPPSLATTDGEELVFIQARFKCGDIASLRQALIKQRNFQHDEGGRDDSFTWLNAKDIIIGSLRLDEGMGIAFLETNSRERLKKWEKKLRTLGQVSLIDKSEEPFESMAGRERDRDGSDTSRPDPLPPEALMELAPQLEKHFAEMWLKEKVPALGGRTPLEAARTHEGRLRLRELMDYMENLEARRPKGTMGGFDIDKMKARLGLV